MVKTTRDFEIEATDKRIQAIEDDIVSTKKYAKIATALKNLEQTSDYQLAVQGYMIDEESDRLCGHLTGSEPLSEAGVKAINEALATIRGFKSVIASTKKLGDTAENDLADLKARLKEEHIYRNTVALCKDDLSDLTDRLGA